MIEDDALLNYYRNQERCSRCLQPCWPCEPHHCYRKGMGGGSRMDVCLNILAVCRACHQHLQEAPGGREEGWRLIEKREGLEEGQAEAAVWVLLRRPNR